MSSQAHKRYTPEEYWALERQAPCKSEYDAGDLVAMAGASRWHHLIVANVVGELRAQLQGRPCTAYPSDMRVKVSATGLYTDPDVTVVCGEAQCEDRHQDTLLNPTLIVAGLSESTAADDRGGKFAPYRKIPSLMEYVLLAPTAPHIEHDVRQPDNRWLLAEADSLSDTIYPPSIDGRLALAEVYDKVGIVRERGWRSADGHEHRLAHGHGAGQRPSASGWFLRQRLGFAQVGGVEASSGGCLRPLPPPRPGSPAPAHIPHGFPRTIAQPSFLCADVVARRWTGGAGTTPP
jgi:Uma2 family endonuclease